MKLKKMSQKPSPKNLTQKEAKKKLLKKNHSVKILPRILPVANQKKLFWTNQISRINSMSMRLRKIACHRFHI